MTPAEAIEEERVRWRAEYAEAEAYDEDDMPDEDASADDAPESASQVRISEEPLFERGDQVELAEHYASTLAPAGEAVHDEGATYRYDITRGLFVALPDATQSCTVQGYAGIEAGEKGKSKPLKLSASDVSGVLTLARARLASPRFFADAPAGLAFEDGFVVASEHGARRVPHSPDHRARHGFAFAFDGPSKPAGFLKMLGEVFEPDDDREQKIARLQELGGAAITGISTDFQKCVVFTGVGANGKSAVIRIVESAMPAGSVVSIPPQRWGNEYRRASLATALLNVVSELPESDILDAEIFKAIVTGDMIDAREIYGSPFMLSPRAGHLFAANRLPGTNDTTLGFWRRFDVIPFNRRFEGSDANPRIAEDIIAAEQPMIVRWFLAGAVRLLAQRGYTVPPSSLEAVQAWRRSANPVAIFVDECTRDATADEPGTKASQLYQQFRSWCEHNGHRPMASTKFGMRMGEIGKGHEKARDANYYRVVFNGGGAT
jgi:P4 family phage/plasmid primase-like protien